MEEGTENIGQRTSHDTEVTLEIENIINKYDIKNTEVASNFPVYARRIHMTKFLAHYEIFKMIQNLPGSIVELGVFRGSSFLSFAKFIEIFNPGDRARKIIGFDHFKGLNDFVKEDGDFNDSMSKNQGGWNPANFKNELIENIDLFHKDSFIPRAKRCEIVDGDITQTVPEYIEKNPGLRISLLHFDCDLFKPTKIGLEYLLPKVVKGGVILFDEYGLTEWAGESEAADLFFKSKNLKIQKFTWCSTPGAYIINE